MTKGQTPPEDATRQALSPEFLHELRTPLNQIIGYCQMLVEQAEEEGQPGFVPDLQEIQISARLLVALLSNDAEVPSAGAPSTPATPPTPKSNVAASSPPDIEEATQGLLLVVDDNYRNRDMLSRRLEKQGYDVARAENGREAMKMVRSQAFDLILLDIMMPEIDGFEVLRQIKVDEALRHIPVIMISALHEIDSVVRCVEMGADDYLCKPFDPTLLKARIGACLDKKRARDREVRLFEQLQQSYGRLQELEKLRDDLTNMIIHDLRTPLTSVIGGMQTLEMSDDLDDAQREMVEISISGGEMLLGMINDLLDVEKLESGTMQLDVAVLDVAELITSAAGQVASLSASKNLTLVRQIVADLPPFRGDESKLCRVLVNLLGNAIKFTPEGGTVTISARLDENKQMMLIIVSDTGEGIPSGSFERIFEKFGQVESRKLGRKMSTGLGLTFCKLAVEAHGGHIKVESVPEEGSTFSFTLPLESTGYALK